MRLFIPYIYRLQHKILERTYNSDKDANGNVTWPTVKELCQLFKTDDKQILRAAHLLEEKEFAKALVWEHPIKVVCLPKGKIAYFQEYYLDEGWEKTKVNALRYLQMFGILIASVISFITFIINILQTNTNNKEISRLKADAKQLQLSYGHLKQLIEDRNDRLIQGPRSYTSVKGGKPYEH